MKVEDTNSHSNHRTINLDASSIQHYKKCVKMFEQKINTYQQNKQRRSKIYYIVSILFIDSWKTFCRSQQQQRKLPCIMNIDLFVQDTHTLKNNIKEKQEFVFLISQVYDLLSEFKYNQLRRVSYINDENKEIIPIYVKTYRYVCLTNYDIKQIDRNQKNREDIHIKIIQESEDVKVSRLVDRILRDEGFGDDYKGRCWNLKQEWTQNSLYEYFKKCAEWASYQYSIKGFGLPQKKQTLLKQLQLNQNSLLLIEINQLNKIQFLQSDLIKKCQNCNIITELNFPCQCNKISYCCEECREKDKQYHNAECEYVLQLQLQKPLRMQMNAKSLKGLVGIRNIGSSCYIGTCLQCLSHTLDLTKYFLDCQYLKYMGKDITIGGNLVKHYAKFINCSWCLSDKYFVPQGLQQCISLLNPSLKLYAQHDPHQYLLFMLNVLSQNLNKNKKQSHQSLHKYENSKLTAQKSWEIWMGDKQSIITDLMVGQYVSKVTCLHCYYKSITFEPFLTVTLPIPQTTVRIFEGFYISNDFNKSTKRLFFQYNKLDFKDWMIKLSNLLKLNQNEIILYLVSISQGIYRVIPDNLSLIRHKLERENKNIFIFQLSEEEMGMRNRLEVVTRFSKFGQQKLDNLWYKIPFFFQKDSTNGEIICKKILKFLYRISNEKSWGNYNNYQRQMIQKLQKFKNTSYKEQQRNKMREQNIFYVFIRYNRRIEINNKIQQYFYERQEQIYFDTKIEDLLSNVKNGDFQLDIKFTRTGFNYFNIYHLNKFQEITPRMKTNYLKNIDIQLSTCFQNLQEEQILKDQNMWFCPNCQELRSAKKQIKIYKAPDILMIHFKRSKKIGKSTQKIQSKIVMPKLLDLSPYLEDLEPMSSYREMMNNEQEQLQINQNLNKLPLYELYAVSNYSGTLDNGHFKTVVKNNNKWYEFDDSACEQYKNEGGNQNMMKSKAYLLFYQRQKEHKQKYI